MNRKLQVLALVVALSGSVGFAALGVSAGVPEQGVSEQVEPAAEVAATAPAPAEAAAADGIEPAPAVTLPSCSSMHGNSCPVAGVVRRCWWEQAGEPTICRCQSSPQTWKCLGLG